MLSDERRVGGNLETVGMSKRTRSLQFDAVHAYPLSAMSIFPDRRDACIGLGEVGPTTCCVVSLSSNITLFLDPFDIVVLSRRVALIELSNMSEIERTRQTIIFQVAPRITSFFDMRSS